MRSEARAQQRLAPGGRSPHNPDEADLAHNAPHNPEASSVKLMVVIGNIAQFWRLTRELDVNGLRESLERPVNLRVLGSDINVAQRAARLIEPDPAASEVSAGGLGELSRARAEL